MSKGLRAFVATLALLLMPALGIAAERIRYLHTDHLGSVVAVTDEQGRIVERTEYDPWGKGLRQPMRTGPGYTGHVQDPATGLVYTQQRLYDPDIPRFLSVDAVTAYGGDLRHFNPYTYAYNNPYKFTDPDGRQAVSAVRVAFAADMAVPEPTDVAWPKWAGWAAAFGVAAAIDYVMNESAEGQSQSGNSNPYEGPVDEPVIVVDGDGNAIPVAAGEQIHSSPDGRYQQVKDQNDQPTGIRMDKGGHPKLSDPKAQAPHGHRPGVADGSGNPHLPLEPPKPAPKEKIGQ